MKKLTLLTVCMALVLSICSGHGIAATKNTPTEELQQNLEEAYIYAFPLVLMDATETSATNTETAVAGKAPVNQFIHARELVDAKFKNVVTPNVDTIYSQVWYDLSSEPMIYELPETDRFCKVQVLDAWTNTAAVLDKAGTYAITKADWQGDLPKGVTRVDVPTSMAWSITRTLLSGQEDLPNVHAIQKQMKLMPLSAYMSADNYQPAKGSYNEANNYVPINKVLSMSPAEFFNKANELMENNPPAAEDKEIIAKIAKINVGPGQKFSSNILGKNPQTQWNNMLQQIRPKLNEEARKYFQKLGQWDYYGAPIGDFGQEYNYRALVAMAGLGANTVDVAIYPKTEVDNQGNFLTGEHSYILHFDSFPPVLEGGFWSITAYGEDDFLIDNPLNRYCINDRSDLKANADGTVDIVLAQQAPENITNWLPVSKGRFHLFMRIYTPDMQALSKWIAPTIILK